jgi:uncharacterized protein DUF4398
MTRVRRLVASAVAVAAIVTAACGDPPDKEMQQAQGAIDAAKAAGADQYAPDEYAAAQDALKKANDSVAQRDYRQALNHALDSRERAQTAAREAADHKATARTDADRALTELAAALREAQQRLKAAEARRAALKAIATPRKVVIDGEEAVQKARAAFDQGDYLGATDLAHATSARLRSAAHDLDAVAAAPPPRRRR